MLTNNMTSLLNKIEFRLGTKKLNLPEGMQKTDWADKVIKQFTLPEYSRIFPNVFTYTVVPQRDWSEKLGYFCIDENIIPGDIKIIGCKDYVFSSSENSGQNAYTEYGQYDFFTNSYDVEDIGLVQMAADMSSLINNGLFVEYKDPHMLRLTNALNRDIVHLKPFQVDLFIEHSDSLSTIEPSKIRAFEDLATADVATFLYGELKYFEGLETVFGAVDIKLSDIQSIADRREDYINVLMDNMVTPANKYQPMMYLI